MEPRLFKIPVEIFVKNVLKKKTWQYGDQLMERFQKTYEILVTMECLQMESNGLMGHEVQYCALGWSSSGWHGTKDGAKRKAAWTWLKRLFDESGADPELLEQLLRKFAPEMIEIEKRCSICNQGVENDKIWQHVRNCANIEKLKFYNQMMERTLVLFGICPKKVPISNCPRCNIALVQEEFGQHIMECMSPTGTCRLCGEDNRPDHNCSACPFCEKSSFVKDWLIFPECGHVLCGNEECFRKYKEHFTTRGGKLRCHTCTTENPRELLKLRLPQ